MPDKDKASTDASRNIDRLVNEHAEALYAYALMRVGQRESAEDIVQDTLLAALQSWERFAGHSTERTWLIGILRHKILDLIGDFALAGCRIVGQAFAYRSGHKLNAELVKEVLDRGQVTQRLGNCA